MVYECEACSTALSAGIITCPKCALTFDEAVPSDAEVPRRGWQPKAEADNLPPVIANPTVNVWRLIPYHRKERAAEFAEWIRREGTLAIGWGGIADLSQLHFRDEAQLRRLVAEACPGNTPNSRANEGRSLWRFYSQMQIGDLVIVSASGTRTQTMRVTGGYYYVNNADDPTHHYEHRRRAEVVPIDPNRLWHVTGGAAQGEGIYSTLVRCGQPLSEAEVNLLSD